MGTSAEHLALLALAESKPFGICVQVTDVKALKVEFQQARRLDPTFKHISIMSSPFMPEQELWLIPRRDKQNGS